MTGSEEVSRPGHSTARRSWPNFRIADFHVSLLSRVLAETQTSEATIKALSGHLSRKMLEHYSTIRDRAKRRAVELLDSLNTQGQ